MSIHVANKPLKRSFSIVLKANKKKTETTYYEDSNIVCVLYHSVLNYLFLLKISPPNYLFVFLPFMKSAKKYSNCIKKKIMKFQLTMTVPAKMVSMAGRVGN